jgi:hypothetical protein
MTCSFSKSRGVVTALAGLLGLLVLPVAAEARSETYATAMAPTPNGSRLSILAYDDEVQLSIGNRTAQASYEVDGKAGIDHVAGDLAQFGRVHLTFHKRGRAEEHRIPPQCKGSFTEQPGVYRGTVTFAGDGDVPPVEVTKLEGVVNHYEIHCPQHEPRGHRHGHHHHHHRHHHGHAAPPAPPVVVPVFLDASNTRGEYGTRFDANLFPTPDGKTLVVFDAAVSKRLGPVDAYYSADVRGDEEDFAFNLHHHTATVTPPPPFTGQAHFGEDPEGLPTWTGDLAVTLPALGTVALTGPQFQAELLGPGGSSTSVVFVGRDAGPPLTPPLGARGAGFGPQ